MSCIFGVIGVFMVVFVGLGIWFNGGNSLVFELVCG